MNGLLRTFLILSSALALNACVRMNGDTATGEADTVITLQESFRQSAAGTWQTNCYALGGGFYGKNSFTFQENSFQYSGLQLQWAEPTCTNPALKTFSLPSTFNYDILPNPGYGSNEYLIAATIVDGSSTYFSASVAGANAAHICGFTDWAAGVAKSWFIPGEDCTAGLHFAVQPAVGMIHYTRSKMDYTVSPATFVLGPDVFPHTNLGTVASSYAPLIYYRQP